MADQLLLSLTINVEHAFVDSLCF